LDKINLLSSRHSAFYSPLISCIAGGFLEKEGLEGTYRTAAAGENSAAEVASGRADIGQSAVSGSWAALEKGDRPAVAHFAQINRYDGFIIAAREPDSTFQWSKLRDKRFLHVHGGQPEAMLRYGLHKNGIDLSDLDDIESPGGVEMMRQWRDGEGDYFHEQGAFPQQLEHLGEGHIVGSVGEAVGPTAFSSLVCRWDSTGSDLAKRFTTAYRASRNWVNTAEPMEIARAEASFFPGIAVEATAAAVGYYQQLGTWSGDIAVEPNLYESALDVFAHSNLITRRQAFGDVVVPPPGS
jgi:NitT/TauT family transport system substrate-binding protein